MTLAELEEALAQIDEASRLVKNCISVDPRIDKLITKAERVLVEAGNRMQRMVDAWEDE